MTMLPKPNCAVDAEACIDWAVMGIAEFLKNGYTMSLLALTLIALLRVREKEKKKSLDRYAQSMLNLEGRRGQGMAVSAWAIEKDKIVERDSTE